MHSSSTSQSNGGDRPSRGTNTSGAGSDLYQNSVWTHNEVGISRPPQARHQEAGQTRSSTISQIDTNEQQQQSSASSSPVSSFLMLNQSSGSRVTSESPAASPTTSRRVSPQTPLCEPAIGAAMSFPTHSRSSSGQMGRLTGRAETPDPATPFTADSFTPRATYQLQNHSMTKQNQNQNQSNAGWSAPLEQMPHFGSSADAYAPLPLRASALPRQIGDAQTALLASQEGPGSGERGYRAVTPGADSYGTHLTHDSASRDPRRASHLSFQTATDGTDGVQSVDSGRDVRMKGLAVASGIARPEEVRSAGTSQRVVASSPSGYASSSERPLPGSWASPTGAVRTIPAVFTPKPLSGSASPALASRPVSRDHFESAKNSPAVPMASLPSPVESKESGRGRLSHGGGPIAESQPLFASPTGSRFEEWDLKHPSQGRASPQRQTEEKQRQLDRNLTLRPSNSHRASQDGLNMTKEQPPIPLAAADDIDGDPSTSSRFSSTVLMEATTAGPAVPEKGSSASVPEATSPISAKGGATEINRRPEQLAYDVGSPPSRDVFAHIPGIAPQTSPVPDYRRRPLVDSSRSSFIAKTTVPRPGVGAHNAGASGAMSSSSPPSPEDGRMQRSSAASVLPRAALVEGPGHEVGETIGRAASISSAETPSREPSPPPEGEVEARADWERARMKQKQKRPAPQDSGRRSTIRGQLKPLQLVTTTDPSSDVKREGEGESPTVKTSSGPVNKYSNGAMSTQQLQKQQARDQRRSVGTINLALGSMGGADMASGANGPYPMFPSPSQGAAPGGRQYLGMLPQRSLVPPFELQQRPDGFLSGLIGPDGTRRSINDPEVCLECMMRDEDMIDVDVLGPGLWERESDRDFDEALRLERDEDLRKDFERGGATMATNSGSVGPGDDLSAADHSSTHAASRDGTSRSASAGTKVRVKRVGKHDPLSAERLKLHTQMNPPASSHRWRTLQQFLAVQAKYIAIEQKLLQDEWNRTLPGMVPAPRERSVTAPGTASSMITSADGPGRRSPEAPSISRKVMSKNRTLPLLMPQRGVKLVADEELMPEEKAMREKDVALAREARRKNAGSTSPSIRNMAGAPLPAPARMSAFPSAEDERRTVSGGLSIGSAMPRRPIAGGVSSPARVASASDLRSIPGSMLSATIPSTPESLVPPSAAFSSMSTPRGFGGRTVSQLSLAPSGSLMDMHLAMASSNQADHRAGHGSTLPSHSPTLLGKPASSPQATYFGFPGDGEMSPADTAGPFRTDTMRDNGLASPSLGDTTNDDSGYFRQKKKDSKPGKEKNGFKRFINKLSGGGGTASNGVSSPAYDERPSEDSYSARARRTSMSADSALTPPPGLAGLLTRARRSTSSLLGGNDSSESPREMYMQPPTVSNSRNRFDMGPFQSPLPPERKQSRLAPEERATSPLVDSHRPAPSNSYFGNVPTQTAAGVPAAYRPSAVPVSMQATEAQYKGQGSAMPSNGGAAVASLGSSRAPSYMGPEYHGSTSAAVHPPPPQQQQQRQQPHRKQGPPLGAVPSRQSSSQQQEMLSPGRPDDRRPSVISINSLSPPGRPDRSPRRNGDPGSGSSARQVSSPPSLPHQSQQQQSRPSTGARSLFGPLTSPMRATSGNKTNIYNDSGGSKKDSHIVDDGREELRDDFQQSSPQSYKSSDNRKSRLLRLPFAFSSTNNNNQEGSSNKANKRNSSAFPTISSSNSGLNNSGNYYGGGDASVGGCGAGEDTLPPLRHRASTNVVDTLGVQGGVQGAEGSRPRKSINLFERPRLFSNASSSNPLSVSALPTRSQSALGSYDTAIGSLGTGGGASASGNGNGNGSGGSGFASKLRKLRN